MRGGGTIHWHCHSLRLAIIFFPLQATLKNIKAFRVKENSSVLNLYLTMKGTAIMPSEPDPG